MPLQPLDLIDRRVGYSQVAFDETELPDNFPMARWNAQQQRYFKYWDHFLGSFWEQEIEGEKDEEGHPVARYPLKINYIKTAAIKQAGILIGETDDSVSPAIPIHISPRRKPGDGIPSDELKLLGEQATDFVNTVWDENMGDVLQQENALISQSLGGCIFKMAWAPLDDELENHIRLEAVLPDFFLPVWETGRPDELLEAWVVWRMPAREAALTYGYETKNGANDPVWVEHWTKETVTITLNNIPLEYEVDGEVFLFDDLPNALGEVPFQYIPRKRAGTYYGMSLVDDMESVSIELNARLADLGDLLQGSTQPHLFATNLPNRAIGSVKLDNGRKVFDLGTNGPGTSDPSVFAVDPAHLPDGLREFPGMLLKQLDHDASTPAVAFGEDQGSQRSGATLNLRFYPLVSEARSQRRHWKVGMVRIAKMILRLAAQKGVGGITDAHLKGMQWYVDWAPTLPKDRETELNELMMAIAEVGLHPAEMIEKLHITDDAWKSYKLAQEHYEWKAKVDAEAAAAAKPVTQTDPNVAVKKPTVNSGGSSK